MSFYLALDPGKATGYAVFNEEGEDDDFDTLDIFETRTLIKTQRWKAVICEDWKLRPEAAKFMVWSDMPTSKLIGYVEGYCDGLNIPFILQQPAIKPTAYKLAGRKPLPKSNPLNHAMDAYVHGRYYLAKRGIRT
jgi:hypothetical protein